MLYSQMAELIHGEPSGDTLLTISVNPDDSGTAGLGCVGCKGVELTGGLLFYIKRDIDVGVPNDFVYHEMSHNFDIYNQYIGSYYGDWGHAWTRFLQYYSPFYTRRGDHLGGPQDALDRQLAEDIVPWDALGSSASWNKCVKDGGGCENDGVLANNAWAGLMMRFARLHGPGALQAAFAYLSDYEASNPAPTLAEERNDLLVKMLAAGAGLDISCELDTWHWEFSVGVRAELSQAYPTSVTACTDEDGDGYTPAARDYDDRDATIHPAAVEVVDGRDEDCDGVIDDVLVSEEDDFIENACVAPIFDLPARVSGRIASNVDKDTFKVNVGAGKYVKTRVWSKQGLTGTFCLGEILNCGFGCGITTFAANQVDNLYNPVTLGSMGAVALWPLDFPGVSTTQIIQAPRPGDYELIVDTNQPQVPNPVKLLTSFTDSGAVEVTATVNTDSIDGEAPTAIRFWVNGVGFIETLPVAKSVSLEWTPPQTYCGLRGIRAQLLSGDHPISPATSLNQEIVNISTRARVGMGDRVLIGGFIVTESLPKRLLIRAISSSLPLAGALDDPQLELHDASGQLIASNDNWRDSQEQLLMEAGIPPPNDKESALIMMLDPGAYTAIVRGTGDATGVALVEVYDLDQSADSTLANISTRGVVETGDNVMIGGLIISGDTQADVLVRAIGPALGEQGVSGALADTTLELHDKDGALITSNDDWKDTQQAAIEATGLAPTDDRESAILMTLAPSSYTAIVRGKNDTTGVALVEVYNLSP